MFRAVSLELREAIRTRGKNVLVIRSWLFLKKNINEVITESSSETSLELLGETGKIHLKRWTLPSPWVRGESGISRQERQKSQEMAEVASMECWGQKLLGLAEERRQVGTWRWSVEVL